MPVDIIDSRDLFDHLRSDWSEIYRRDDEAQFFLSWRWLAQLYDRRSEGIYILAYRDSDDEQQYSAFFPLRKEVRYSRRRMLFYNSFCMAGNYWADYTGLICDPEVDTRAIPALAEFLASLPWYRLQLECLKISESRLQLFLSCFNSHRYKVRERTLTDNDGKTRLARCPHVVLPDSFDTYLQTLVSANTRQKIRRYRRKLERDPDLEIRLATTQTLAGDLACFEQYWMRLWSASKGQNAEILAAKYVDIIRSGMVADDMIMPVLLRRGEPVGMLASFVDPVKRTLLFFVSARASDFTDVPVGLLLHACNIEWAIDHEFSRYDLLRGDESYKYSLGAIDDRVVSKVVFQKSPASSARVLDSGSVTQALHLMVDIQKKEKPGLIHTLFSQLLESWPNDPAVLNQYYKWLRRSGNQQHANEIKSFLAMP